MSGHIGRGAGEALELKQPALFDLASLTDKLAKYLPPGAELRCTQHRVVGPDGADAAVALIWVGPHDDGWCVFPKTGDYPAPGGRTKTAFRRGDVYARHGSRSEPWEQADIAVARRRLIAREKDEWRAEHANEVRLALKAATGAATALARRRRSRGGSTRTGTSTRSWSSSDTTTTSRSGG